MGCDIHVVMQRQGRDGFEDVPHEYEENRHYPLFAWLADVRNGYGFAGVPTGSEIVPIDYPRGLPEDFEMDGHDHPIAHPEVLPMWRAKYAASCGELAIWMGDHSHSWLSWDEILGAPNPLITASRVGIITEKQFQAWDGKQPSDWCGGVFGPNVVVCEDPDLFDPAIHSHVRVTWDAPTSDFDYFLNEIRRLRDLHGPGRMVFGFDS